VLTRPRNKVGEAYAGQSGWPGFDRVRQPIILLLLVLFISACSQQPDPSLRLGTNVWPGYEPLYLAEQLGYFPQGAIDLVEYLSASEVIRAFRNRSIEAAALTLDEVLNLIEQKIRMKIILVTDVSNGGDAILARPKIKEFADLAGKRVGVEGGALGAYVITRALDMHDLSLDALQIVQLEVSEHERAYKEREVDAVVTFEPVRSKLIAMGAKELFTSREIPNEIVDVLVVHHHYTEDHPELISSLIDGWFKALDYLRQHPEDAAARMSARLGQSPDDVLQSYDGLTLPSREENLMLLGGNQPRLLEILERLQQIMLSKELLKTPVPLDGVLDTVGLPASGQ